MGASRLGAKRSIASRARTYLVNVIGGAAAGLNERKSSPTSRAIVAAICDVVSVTSSRLPSLGIAGPSAAIHVPSAAGISRP